MEELMDDGRVTALRGRNAAGFARVLSAALVACALLAVALLVLLALQGR